MPIIGNDSKPGYSYHAYASSTQPNQEAEDITLPAGRIRITRLGGWIGGWNDSPRCTLTVWDSTSGAVLAQTGQFSVTNFGDAAEGRVAKYVADLTTPLEADGGAILRVGFTRNRDDRHQVSTGMITPAGHMHGRAAYPLGGFAEIDGGYAENRRIGMWIEDYVTIRGAWVYRGGAWLRAEAVYTYRGGAWVEVDTVSVYRGSTWIEAD
jgi:hypothetical protein